MEPDGLVEGDSFPTGSLLLVRLRPFFGRKVDRLWFIYQGLARGVNERVRIYLSSLGLEVSVPLASVGPTPVVQHHRLPASWLTQYLYTCPLDLEERGVAVQAVRLLEVMSDWVRGRDGVAVGPQGSEVKHLEGEDFRALIARPQLVLLGHDEGRWLPQVESEEFKTPPRPQVTPCLEAGTPPPAERCRTQDSASAIALLASAYECSPDQIRARVPARLDKLFPAKDVGAVSAATGSNADYDLSSAEEARPPLPPRRGLLQAWTCSPLIQVRGAPPILSPQPCRAVPTLFLGSLPTSTSRGLAASLFFQGGVETDRKHLWSGLSNKAGAAFVDALGVGPADLPAASTDRIIHAIDGIRRAQQAEKTGTKGTLASIQEVEKLDVFPARGCGELTVELCKGVYGKELFHSI